MSVGGAIAYVLLIIFNFVELDKKNVSFVEIEPQKDGVKLTKVIDTPHSKILRDTISYLHEKPYGARDFESFFEYWMLENDGINKALSNRENRVPTEVALVKMWWESRGGHSGLAKKDPTALFGVKGKNGIKGYDYVDKEGVQYASYKNRAHSIMAFDSVLLYRNPMYKKRFKAWKKLTPKYIASKHLIPLVTEGDQPDWWYWLLAMQAHPSRNLKLSYSAYALCGWSSAKIKREGVCEQMRRDRLHHSIVMIKKLRDSKELLNRYYDKYGNNYNFVIKKKHVNGGWVKVGNM